MIKLHTLIVLLFVTVSGYGQAVFFSESYYPDGTIQEKFRVYVEKGDSVRHGPYTFYYPEGTIMQEGFYIANLPDSLWVNYYRNGLRKSMYSYSKGKKNGPYKIWKDDGSLYQSGAYKDNLLTGELIT